MLSFLSTWSSPDSTGSQLLAFKTFLWQQMTTNCVAKDKRNFTCDPKSQKSEIKVYSGNASFWDLRGTETFRVSSGFQWVQPSLVFSFLLRMSGSPLAEGLHLWVSPGWGSMRFYFKWAHSLKTSLSIVFLPYRVTYYCSIKQYSRAPIIRVWVNFGGGGIFICPSLTPIGVPLGQHIIRLLKFWVTRHPIACTSSLGS